MGGNPDPGEDLSSSSVPQGGLQFVFLVKVFGGDDSRGGFPGGGIRLKGKYEAPELTRPGLPVREQRHVVAMPVRFRILHMCILSDWTR